MQPACMQPARGPALLLPATLITALLPSLAQVCKTAWEISSEELLLAQMLPQLEETQRFSFLNVCCDH